LSTALSVTMPAVLSLYLKRCGRFVGCYVLLFALSLVVLVALSLFVLVALSLASSLAASSLASPLARSVNLSPSLKRRSRKVGRSVGYSAVRLVVFPTREKKALCRLLGWPVCRLDYKRQEGALSLGLTVSVKG
jgi:hypothetical protein